MDVRRAKQNIYKNSSIPPASFVACLGASPTRSRSTQVDLYDERSHYMQTTKAGITAIIVLLALQAVPLQAQNENDPCFPSPRPSQHSSRRLARLKD